MLCLGICGEIDCNAYTVQTTYLYHVHISAMHIGGIHSGYLSEMYDFLGIGFININSLWITNVDSLATCTIYTLFCQA